MEAKNSKGIVILIVVLSLLVVGLGGYLVYDKVFKDNNIKENQNNNNKAYSVLVSDICPASGDCSKNLDDITLDGNTYKVSIQIYDVDSESWIDSENDYITVNNKKLDLNGFIKFIAVMNNEYLLVGTNQMAPGDEYTLWLFDKNLNLVEEFYTNLQGQEIFNLSKDILDNNTTLLYHVCAMEEVIVDDQNPQKLTTYSVKFANGTFNETQLNVIHNTFCSAEMP